MDKSARLANYMVTMRKELLWLSHACGLGHPALVDINSFEILDDHFGSSRPSELFGYQDGWGLPSADCMRQILEIMDAQKE